MDAEIAHNGHQKHSQAGFTLIELLVSIAIIAVLAVGASLAISRSGSPSANDMALFRNLYDSQRDRAILSGQVRGLILSPQSIEAVALEPQGWTSRTTPRDWTGRVTLSARSVSGLPSPVPDIVLLPTGQGTPFRVVFGGGPSCESTGYERAQCAQN